MLAGAAVVYKTWFQSTIALSSTEDEFVAASDARKMALYLHTLLDKIGVPHQEAFLLYEENSGAFLMAHAGNPTERTQHIDIRHFALLDWVERDLVRLE